MQKERGHLDFILLGFSQRENTRRFFFERTGLGAGIERERFTVEADMGMARRYKIAMQELPLLCRRMLEQADGAVTRTFIFGEAQMCSYAGSLATQLEARELKKKAFRRHAAANAAQA